MRKLFVAAAMLLSAFVLQVHDAAAQRPQVRGEVVADRILSSGLDALYDFDVPAPEGAPAGYEAFYVSHYGRHGSRFPYTASAYTTLLDILQAGAKTDNLTPYGRQILQGLEPLWEKSRYRVGDLTPLGWEQHQKLARIMVKNFPTAFPDGCRVDAISSSSHRAMISMASFCLSLSHELPSADIYEHQGLMEVQATAPNSGKNPLRLKGPAAVQPYPESRAEFFLKTFPGYKNVLARLFKNTDICLGKHNPLDAMDDIYMLVCGMNSLPVEYTMDLSGIFTAEEFARMWECDNYLRFHEYWVYRTPVCSVYDDVIKRADERIAAGECGADLRFGHDHVLCALLTVADIEGFCELPQHASSLAEHFQTFRSPMAANLQYVFFRPTAGDGDTLFRLYLNGEKARIGHLELVDGCYRWADFKSYYASIRSELVSDK